MSRPGAWVLLLAIVVVCPLQYHLPVTSDNALQKYTLDSGGQRGVPLERYLWAHQMYPVTGIQAGSRYIGWEAAAYRSPRHVPVLVAGEGELVAFGEKLPARWIAVDAVPRPDRSIMDVAPTACGALGIEGSFEGRPACRVNASQVVVLYIDAIGWDQYAWARPVMRNLSYLGEPEMACCVYPSISNVNGAAMLTGVSPERSGVDRWENRTILADDAISMALRDGVSAMWVDGLRTPVSLSRGIVRVGDADGDGSPDDEIVDRAASEHLNGTRLLFVHLRDADRALHEAGPRSPRSLAAAARADVLAGRLIGQLRPGTLLLVVADHGGHDLEGGRGGHGTLLPRDMLVPFFSCVVN